MAGVVAVHMRTEVVDLVGRKAWIEVVAVDPSLPVSFPAPSPVAAFTLCCGLLASVVWTPGCVCHETRSYPVSLLFRIHLYGICTV